MLASLTGAVTLTLEPVEKGLPTRVSDDCRVVVGAVQAGTVRLRAADWSIGATAVALSTGCLVSETTRQSLKQPTWRLPGQGASRYCGAPRKLGRSWTMLLLMTVATASGPKTASSNAWKSGSALTVSTYAHCWSSHPCRGWLEPDADRGRYGHGPFAWRRYRIGRIASLGLLERVTFSGK
jgi:hypothetical protein